MDGPTLGQLLHVTSGPESGTSIEVGAEGVILGRLTGGPGELARDPSVSRKHAEVGWTTDGELCIRDLGSTNGTIIRGKRIVTGRWRVLHKGETIQVGDSVITVGGPRSGGWSSAIDTQPSSRPSSDVHISGGVHAEQEGVAVGRDFFGGVHTRNEYDASGLGFISRTRGFARFLIILGMLISFAGAASWGYPIVKAISSNADNSAIEDCQRRFPNPGFDQNECIFKAESNTPDFEVMPWLPLGAILALSGGIITTAGIFSVRRDRND